MATQILERTRSTGPAKRRSVAPSSSVQPQRQGKGGVNWAEIEIRREEKAQAAAMDQEDRAYAQVTH